MRAWHLRSILRSLTPLHEISPAWNDSVSCRGGWLYRRLRTDKNALRPIRQTQWTQSCPVTGREVCWVLTENEEALPTEVSCGAQSMIVIVLRSPVRRRPGCPLKQRAEAKAQSVPRAHLEPDTRGLRQGPHHQRLALPPTPVSCPDCITLLISWVGSRQNRSCQATHCPMHGVPDAVNDRTHKTCAMKHLAWASPSAATSYFTWPHRRAKVQLTP